MNFWKSFRQLAAVVQVAIITAILVLILVVAFDKDAGSNLVNFLLTISALLGGSTLLKVSGTMANKRRNENHTKNSSMEDSSEEEH